MSDRPLCLLLLPRPLEQFILRESAEHLLEAPGVVALDPPKVRYGALGRLPGALSASVADRQAKRLLRSLRRAGPGRAGVPRVVVLFHPLQLPFAEAIMRLSGPLCELWYGRWDRYERAYDASPRLRERLDELHERAARLSAMTFVASEELARLEAAEGRPATLVALSADAFPKPDPTGTVVALSLGHLGRRTDWGLLRAVSERLGDRLVLLLVGEYHPDEVSTDPDAVWCEEAPNLVWLGRRSDAEAARLLLTADVGIVPFKVEPFNDAGLPYRILKYARMGRHTVAPELAGVQTWARAVRTARDPDAFAAALLAHAGDRAHPDLALREWALQQTVWAQSRPLWDALRRTGVDTGGR